MDIDWKAVAEILDAIAWQIVVVICITIAREPHLLERLGDFEDDVLRFMEMNRTSFSTIWVKTIFG
jgi:hypothetical protein